MDLWDKKLFIDRHFSQVYTLPTKANFLSILKINYMTDKEIEEVYQIIKGYHEEYLKKHGVKLPKLKDADRK